LVGLPTIYVGIIPLYYPKKIVGKPTKPDFFTSPSSRPDYRVIMVVVLKLTLFRQGNKSQQGTRVLVCHQQETPVVKPDHSFPVAALPIGQ
jgi:hypothetical protein